MRVTRYTDLWEFSARVEPYLLAHEAEHCLPLGLVSSRHTRLSGADVDWYMACVEDASGQIGIVGLQTSPNNLILSRLAPSADVDATVQALASDARDTLGHLPGVIAQPKVGAVFARAWTAMTGEQSHVGVRERIYQLDAVDAPNPAPGAMRAAVAADRDLLLEWMRAFMIEALGQDTSVDDMVDRRLRPGSESGMRLWVDGEVVSTTGYGSPTPHGVRIGPVYTPPALRGRGYASALVAQTSQQLLDEGRRFCFLYTDLANPTSNHIYQRIGYKPVADASEIVFESASPTS